MLEFSRLKLTDIDKLRPLIMSPSSNICNNTVGGIFMWRDYFPKEYAVVNKTAIFKAQTKYAGVTTAFSLPLGSDRDGAIQKVDKYCRTNNMPTAFYAVTNNDLPELEKKFRKYHLFSKEDWSDYIYHADDIINLPGRKYSGKRNHINAFKRSFPDYTFEEISPSNVRLVRDFYTTYSRDAQFDSDTAVEDNIKTVEVLDNYDVFGQIGGMLKANDNIIAFSLGEIKNDTLFVHVEKADTKYPGSYQVLNNEFAKYFATEGVKFINREEDDGDLGLRFSKKSYHPCEIIEKHLFVVE